VADCAQDLPFGVKTDAATAAGSWTFGGLREGYYQVNVAATAHNAAKLDANMRIDDDGAHCGDANAPNAATCDERRTIGVVDDLRGRRAFNQTPATFYVYNRTLANTSEATFGLKQNNAARTVIPLTDPTRSETEGADAQVLDAPLAFANRAIRVSGNLLTGAPNGSFQVSRVTDKVGATVTEIGDTLFVGSGAHNDTVTVSLPYNRTGATPATSGGAEARQTDLLVRVVAQNGYNDGYYKIQASVTNPVGNGLATPSPEANDAGFTFPAARNGGTEPFTGTGWTTNGQRFLNSVAAPAARSSVTMRVVLQSNAANVPQQTLRVTLPDGTPLTHTLVTATAATYDVTLPLPARQPAANEFHVTVTSEDGVAARYIIEILRAAS
jgi:hypothetical protein